jgi:hypothetical protein
METMVQARQRHRTGKEREILTSREDYLNSVVQATDFARRGLAIMTPDLEPDIYANPEFLDVLTRFVLARSFARIRVLITQPERAQKTGNQFVELGRRLNSYIAFRNLDEAHRPRQEAFCIVDDQAVIYRPRYDSWDGIADAGAPAVARMYLETFDNLWQVT